MKPNYISRLVLIIIGITMLITGIRMLVMGVDAYIQPLHHTDWVTTSANVTDISESVINGIRGGHLSSRTSINYWMTYEYEVDGTHYTGEYGPLANSIAVGKSIQIKYDPDAPENSTGFLSPSSSDLVFAVAGLILAAVGFFISGVFGLIRRLIGKDHSDGKEEKGGISAEDAAYERKVKIVNTLRALFPILAFVLFGVLIMLLQGARF